MRLRWNHGLTNPNVDAEHIPGALHAGLLEGPYGLAAWDPSRLPTPAAVLHSDGTWTLPLAMSARSASTRATTSAGICAPWGPSWT